VQSLEVDVDLEMQTLISKNRKIRDFAAQPLEGGPPLAAGEIMKPNGVTREEFLVGWSTGVSNSETEHRVMERQLGKPSFSAMKMLANALEQGKPMLMISKAQLATEAGRSLTDSETSAAISAKLKGLSPEPGVEAGIKDAVQQGKMVFAVEALMSETAADDPNFQQYQGAGYIFVDPADGSGGYIITGQAGGSAVLCGSETADVAELVACATAQLGALAPYCCCSGIPDIGPTSNSVADAAAIDACAGCAANIATAFIDVSGVIGDAIACMVADLIAPAMEALTSQIDDMLAAYPNGGRGVEPSQDLRRMADTISVTLIGMLGLFSNTTSQLLDSLGISLPFPPGTGAILGGYMAIFMAHFLVLDLMLENPDF
jgi:hypothetical protein